MRVYNPCFATIDRIFSIDSSCVGLFDTIKAFVQENGGKIDPLSKNIIVSDIIGRRATRTIVYYTFDGLCDMVGQVTPVSQSKKPTKSTRPSKKRPLLVGNTDDKNESSQSSLVSLGTLDTSSTHWFRVYIVSHIDVSPCLVYRTPRVNQSLKNLTWTLKNQTLVLNRQWYQIRRVISNLVALNLVLDPSLSELWRPIWRLKLKLYR